MSETGEAARRATHCDRKRMAIEAALTSQTERLNPFPVKCRCSKGCDWKFRSVQKRQRTAALQNLPEFTPFVLIREASWSAVVLCRFRPTFAGDRQFQSHAAEHLFAWVLCDSRLCARRTLPRNPLTLCQT